MYNLPEIAMNIKAIAKQKQISLKDLLAEVDLNINTISAMAKGREISCIALASIADKLDVSVDSLLGREENTNIHINSHNQTSVNDSTVQINSDTTADGIENEMIAQFRSLPFSSKVNVMNCIQKESEKNVKA